MYMENLEYLSSPLSVQHTYEDEVREELCLQLAESVSDLGACDFSREIVAEGAKWLVTVTRR